MSKGHNLSPGTNGEVVRNINITLGSQTGGKSLAGSEPFLIENQSAGFVPAFLVGNLHMTKLPGRYASPACACIPKVTACALYLLFTYKLANSALKLCLFRLILQHVA